MKCQWLSGREDGVGGRPHFWQQVPDPVPVRGKEGLR